MITPLHTPALDEEILDFEVLQNIDAERVGASGKTPGDGVVADRPAAPLPDAAEYGVAALGIKIQRRRDAAHVLRAKQLGVDAVDLNCVGEPRGVSISASEWATLMMPRCDSMTLKLSSRLRPS